MNKKIIGVAFIIFLYLVPNVYAVIPASEREALISLYNSTDGTNWLDNTNWLGASGSECSWYGVSCDATESHVERIILQKNQLNGTIPGQLDDLSNLLNLNLAENQLTGSIPPELGSLANLEKLYLFDNQLSGTIPPELGNLSNLIALHIDGEFTGTIPPELGNLSNLTELYIYSKTLLSGGIPAEFGNMSSLGNLYLRGGLSGSIPAELGNLSNLFSLHIADNRLTGTIPTELGSLLNLTHLSLASNQLNGNIPPEIGNLTKLTFLSLNSNKLYGSIPPEIGNLINLESIHLYNNQLGCEIPAEILNLTLLTDEGSDFRYNSLYTSDQNIRDFMNSKQFVGDWEITQTPSCSNCVEDDSGTIDVPSVTVTNGSAVIIPVRIQNAPANVEALGFDISVPEGLTYVSFAKGSLLPSNYVLSVNSISGNIFRCGIYRQGGTDIIAAGSSGEIVQITFNATGTITETQMSLSELKDDISTWFASSGCLIKDDCNGDINNDGEITPQDALLAFQKYMLICPTSTGLKCEDFCADVNKDGSTTPSDALCIFKKYLGSPSCLD